MTSLIPINYQGLHTSEVVFDTAWADPIRRFRMTRKGWGEFFGAKQPQNYIDNLKKRYPELPEGIPVTVTGMTGQQYAVLTLGIWDGYLYAVKSVLPKAKEFLWRFPAFMNAVRTNSLIPDRMLAAIATKPPHSQGRRQMVLQAAHEAGEGETTVYRRVNRIIEGQPIAQNCPGMKKGYLHKKHRAAYDAVISLWGDNLKPLEIAARTGVYLKTVYRWIKKPLK